MSRKGKGGSSEFLDKIYMYRLVECYIPRNNGDSSFLYSVSKLKKTVFSVLISIRYVLCQIPEKKTYAEVSLE